MKRAFVIVVVLAFACVAAAPAFGQDPQVVAPPGNSGVEEYLEVVPGAGGDKPSSESTPAPSTGSANAGAARATPRAVLGRQTATALNRLGADGRAAAAAAAAGAPAQAARGGAKQRERAKQKTESVPVVAGDGGRAGAVAGALTGQGGGMGLAFPLVLLGALAATLGIIAVRRAAGRG